jgi:hypothetical protein
LDLYKEDPAYIAPLTPARVASIYEGLDLAEREADELARDRARLADQLFATYESLYALAVKARTGSDYDKGDLSIDRGHLESYKQKLTAKAKHIKALSRTAREKLAAHLKSFPAGAPAQDVRLKSEQIEALRSVRSVAQELIELAGSLDTDFELGFINLWPSVTKTVSEENLKKLIKVGTVPKEFDAVRRRVGELGQLIKELQSRGRRVSENTGATLARLSTIEVTQPAAMKRSFDAIAAAATELPLSVGLGDRGATAIHDLAISAEFLYTQLDRLQDPADPIWRVVSSPENEAKWNTQFSNTYFYSEGNNSVVVVRDTPISFRVQRGNNNPVALVQSQLQISRAIGNVAISIAAASTGVPLPRVSGAGPAGTQSGDGSSVEAEKLATAKATVERQAAVRAQAVRNLSRNLSALKDDFKAADPKKNPEGVKALLARLAAVLDAHLPVFTASPAQ